MTSEGFYAIIKTFSDNGGVEMQTINQFCIVSTVLLFRSHRVIFVDNDNSKLHQSEIN